MSERIFDTYYRSGKNFIRMPVDQDKSPLSTGDAILDWVLFDCSPKDLQGWRVEENEVEAWSAALVRGNVPEGYSDLNNFVAKLKRQIGYKYDEERRQQRKQ